MKRALPLLSLLVLAACTKVGPDYHLPDEAAINAPHAQGSFTAMTSKAVELAPVPEGWWKLYDDPRLNALEEKALAANTDLRIAAANLARSQAVQSEIEGHQDIQGGASFAVDRAQLSGESFLVPAQLPSQWLGDGAIKIGYQLDLFGRLKRAAEAADADTQAVAAAQELARISVAGEVARAYVEACSAGYEMAVAQRQVDLQGRSNDIIRRLSDAGRGSKIDVTRGEAQLEQARSALPGLRARHQIALYRLATLTGKPPADYPKELENCTELPRIHRPIPVGDGAALLKRRPDIRQAERSLAAATARIGVATAALYPDITLGGQLGATGLITDLGKPAAQEWGFGPLISWTFPLQSEQARVDEADEAAKAALARFDGVVLNALRETESSLAVYQHDLERNAILHAARDKAAEASGEADSLYKGGRTPYLTGLLAQQTLTTSEQSLAASDSQVSLDQVTLFLALGGGWPQH
jgi:NodT family efflux transporter outer membrane factor (OMF) lipoprotein